MGHHINIKCRVSTCNFFKFKMRFLRIHTGKSTKHGCRLDYLMCRCSSLHYQAVGSLLPTVPILPNNVVTDIVILHKNMSFIGQNELYTVKLHNILTVVLFIKCGFLWFPVLTETETPHRRIRRGRLQKHQLLLCVCV